jgi:hypothetical protein
LPHRPTLVVALARQLVGRARRSWVLLGLAAVIATPVVVRGAAGSLTQATATASGAALVDAATEAPDDARDLVRAAAVVSGLEAARGAGRGKARATGRHLGFDTSRYPGDAALRRWAETAPYEWVGFYLPAPCHRDASWSGKRETIAGLGFGMAVVYVGQQTWGRTPRPTSAAARAAAGRVMACNADLVGADRGALEGRDAVARTAAEGFAQGTIVFLDIERMPRTPAAMRAYYRAWTREVLADGRFVPGVYVHAHNAAQVHDDLVAEYAAARRAMEPPVWVASGRDFARDKAPHEVGHWFADVWQGVLDRVESHGGVRIPIDVNVAAVPSPSAVYAVGE